MLEFCFVLVFWCLVNIKKFRIINIGIDNIKGCVLYFYFFDVVLYLWYL